jgi:hypothetical protein
LPKGAPPSTIEALLAFIHFIHVSIPFCRCSGVDFSSSPRTQRRKPYTAHKFFHPIVPVRNADGKSCRAKQATQCQPSVTLRPGRCQPVVPVRQRRDVEKLQTGSRHPADQWTERGVVGPRLPHG